MSSKPINMIMKATLLVLLPASMVMASEGELHNNSTCSEEWPPEGPSSDTCLTACGLLAGKIAGNYHSQSAGDCTVTITQVTQATFDGKVVSDACGSLVATCPRKNATSEFRGTGGSGKETDAGGTLMVTWGGRPELPTTEPESVVSRPTASNGEYKLNKTDCSNALQFAFPKGKKEAKGPLTNHQGNCNATIVSSINAESTISTAGASTGGQDILTVPANCNADNLCRTFINSTIANHQGSSWDAFVVFTEAT